MIDGGGPPFSSVVNGVIAFRLAVADEALWIIENTRQTDYQHKIYIDAATGTYDVDCSGFASYVLSRVAPKHLAVIPGSAGEKRLLAHDYAEFFSSQPTETTDGWRQIQYLHHARRGDLIAWKLAPSHLGNTGHVFFVAEQPVAVSADTMAVMAYDASDILHYDDSRGPGPDQFATGVGSGILHLQINSAGRPIAYQFGPGDPVKFDSSIAIGRIERFDT